MDETSAKLLDNRVTTLEGRVEVHGKQIDELRLNREHDSTMLTNIQAAVLGTQHSVDKLEAKIDEQAGRGSKRWETVVGAVISGIIAVIITFVAVRTGLQ